MYPPLSQSQSHSGLQPLYDPVSYSNSAATSRDYLGEQLGSVGNMQSGSPHLGYANTLASDSTAFLAGSHHGEKYSDAGTYDSEGPPAHMLRSHGQGSNRKGGMFAGKRKRWFIIGGILLLLVVVAAIVGGVVAAKNLSDSGSNDASRVASEHDKGAGEATRNSAISGGNGTEITMEDGTKFTYINNFGGHWEATPFSNNAQPNSWTKPLNQSWDFTNDKSVPASLSQQLWAGADSSVIPF